MPRGSFPRSHATHPTPTVYVRRGIRALLPTWHERVEGRLHHEYILYPSFRTRVYAYPRLPRAIVPFSILRNCIFNRTLHPLPSIVSFLIVR